MQQSQPVRTRSNILTWLVVFGFIALLLGQFRLAEQIKELRKDRADLAAKLELANQQINETTESVRAVEGRPSSNLITPSASSQSSEVRIADLEQRLNALLSRVDTARARAGFDYISNNLTPVIAPADTEPGKRAWGEEQVTGAPNTPVAADASTAWASRDPDSGHEWLGLQFAKPVDIAEVRIRESYNPGAISKVVAVVNNQGIVLWEGTSNPGAAPRDFVVPVTTLVQSATIHIHLDTARVEGWNEIDAVELVGKDGSRQWAASASASSTYAARNTAANP